MLTNPHRKNLSCYEPFTKVTIYRVLVGKPQGKRPLERPRRRREDNIKIYLQEVRCGGMDRSGSGQGQMAGTCECGDEHSGFIK